MPICFCSSGCALNPLADPGVFGSSCSCFCHHAAQAARKPNDEQRYRSLIDTIADRLDPDGRFGDVRDEAERKLLPTELPRAAAVLCVKQTAYGMPGTAYCEQPATPGALLCARHRREHVEQYGPHPCSNAFLGYRRE